MGFIFNMRNVSGSEKRKFYSHRFFVTKRVWNAPRPQKSDDGWSQISGKN